MRGAGPGLKALGAFSAGHGGGGGRGQGVYVSRVGNETGVSRKWLGVQRTRVDGEAHGRPGHGPRGARGVEWGRRGLEEAAEGRDVPTPAEG